MFIVIFQGRVKVAGSVISASYLIVFGFSSFQRSTTFIPSEWKLPARSNQVSPFWSVTVTTSVSPSHLPTDCPIQLGIGAGPGSLNRTLRTAPSYSYEIRIVFSDWMTWNGSDM